MKFKHVYVIARDEIRFINYTQLPIAVVVNTDVKTGIGIHWCGLVVYKKSTGERVGKFFDSYNNPISKYKFQIQLPSH